MKASEKDFSGLEKKIGVKFKNGDLLKQAFVHRSYLNENKKFYLPHNERLEFLGDAVLELVTTEFLYQKYPDYPEGVLTSLRSALVNTDSLSNMSTELGMEGYLMLSKGEAKDTGKARFYILANTYEALIGAIYLDQGYPMAKDFIERTLLPKVEWIVSTKSWRDAKSYLQEKAQEILKVTPQYAIIREAGPDHNKTFTVGVYLGEELVGEGIGRSKQEAEQRAASLELEKRGWL